MKDVLIVGSGAGGGPLAASLAEAGFTVLVLEKGPEHSPDRYVHDEIAVVRRDFFNSSLADEPHMLLRSGETRAERSNLGWIARCVGGGTVHMAGYFYRLHPDDFRMRARFGGYEALADWPFDYRELEPYYTRVEWEIGVSGAADREPEGIPRSRPYPLPPVDTHPLAAMIDEACEKLELRAFPSPRAILSRPYRGRPACVYCDFCGSYGCEVGAKSNSQTALLPRARATGRAEVVAEAMVKEITVDARGRATGCVYVDRDGVEREARARVVCVCASAVESARLLLMSRSGRFPNGLANNGGQVGRNLQFQAFSTGGAKFRYANHPGKPLKARHPFLGRSVRDHYFLPREGIAPIAKGGLIRFGFPHANPIYTAVRLAHADGPTTWGPLLKERIREYYHDYRMIEFEAFHDFVPNDRTFVSLDPKVRDKYGLSVARIHLDEPEQHERAGRWLMERGLEVLHAAGADELVPGSVGGTTGHLVHGTCRAGRDPAASALNEHCQAHEVPNLFVVDGSFMPTSGGVPTTLTIMANSFRVADHIAVRLRSDK
jgi:choline dehydrogenase-like flavoprotein